MKRAIAIFCLLAVAAPPAAASADLKIDGHGFGHGIGMSQWGALGYAKKTRHTYRFILSHYYPGTSLKRTAARSIRVLLKEGPSLLVAEATSVSAHGHATVKLSEDRTYRFDPDPVGLRLVDTKSGATRARLASPATVSGGTSVRLRGRAQNGVMSGRYHGRLVIGSGLGGLSAVNRLDLEQYLYGVVPSEMPASWPAQALRTQAVAARSFAIRAIAPVRPFDVFADTRSQVYRGITAEQPRTTSAVTATSRDALFFKGAVAQTLFSSSSGGRTAAVEEEFGGPSVPYLRSVDDPFDTLSPFHDWSVSLSSAEATKKLGTLVLGDLQDITVVARNSSGRAAIVEIRGSVGITQASGVQIRAALGLRSTWFALHFMP